MKTFAERTLLLLSLAMIVGGVAMWCVAHDVQANDGQASGTYVPPPAEWRLQEAEGFVVDLAPNRLFAEARPGIIENEYFPDLGYAETIAFGSEADRKQAIRLTGHAVKLRFYRINYGGRSVLLMREMRIVQE
jgi:hypothetical protein